MASYAYELNIHSPGPPAAVYALLVDIPGWARWGKPVIRKAVIDRPGATEPCGVGAIRKIGSPPFMSREEITELEPDRHMAYVIRDRGPTRSYRADVDLTATPDGGTDIRWRGELEPTVPGTGLAVRWAFARAVGLISRKLAAEAGRTPAA
jgi:polyketide cyclase/dehydrase/lipid transport protein